MNITSGYQYGSYSSYDNYVNEKSDKSPDTNHGSYHSDTYDSRNKRNTDTFVRTFATDNSYPQYAPGYNTNITVDPEYLAKTESDPELKAKYLSDIEDIKQADMMFSKSQSANGVKIVSRGWIIDKNGDISSWVISKTDKSNDRSMLQRMNENLDKIRTKKAKKKIEEEKRKIAIQKRKIENEKKLLALKKKKKVGNTGKMFCNYA